MRSGTYAEEVLVTEIQRLRECWAEALANYAKQNSEVEQLRGTLSLAEEGLASYAQENERLKSEILEARRVGRPPKALWLQEPQTQPQSENNNG